MVEVSWIAKPCESSSRCIKFRCPPYFGAWADAGATGATTMARHSEIATAKVRERFIVLLSLRRPGSRAGFATGLVGKPAQNIRHGRWSDNPPGHLPTRRVMTGGGALASG